MPGGKNLGGHTVPRITRAEHIGPDDTGDNIEAKRVAGYVWNPAGLDINGDPNGAWERQTTTSVGLRPGTDYDYIDAQQTSSTVDTYVYKLGGSGGTTVQTVTVTYTDATKADLDTVSYS